MQSAVRFEQFSDSVIREMTRHALECGAINLSQGYPDFGPPESVLRAATDAIWAGHNQYTATRGFPPLRNKLAEIYTEQLGWSVDPDVNITVTCGVTEAIVVAQMAILNPGDEIIIIEPAHENFRAGAIMAGAVPVPVTLEPPAYRLDSERIEAAVTPRTRALLLNTPHNPTGRVFDDEEIAALTDLILRHDMILITDEIYHHILYDGRVHVSPGSLEPLRERTITTSGLGKTFAVTGWRLGYMISPDSLATAVHRAHDYMTICAPTPLQAAGVAALELPKSFFEEQTQLYHTRRDLMMGYLEEAGFRALLPEGAYYTIADYRSLPVEQAKWDSMRFAMWMTQKIGVAVVPLSSFFTDQSNGVGSVRFAFAKKLETLHDAGARLARIRAGA